MSPVSIRTLECVRKFRSRSKPASAFAFFAEVDTEAAVGEARLAETLALDTPSLTADFGVLDLDALAAAGDLTEGDAGELAKTTLDFPGLGFRGLV